ncbi:MAG TPA: phosphatase PAP2-related protein [Candidatus Paceibacterota bacterium]|nr:phosphatase PAP2-related protein [Candidatus Paceibacterota bacterium]
MALLSGHKGFWTAPRRRSLYEGIIFSVIALIVQSFAGQYSAKSATNIVGDLFLDNLPTIDFTRVLVEGAFLVTLIALTLLIVKPKHILFALKVIPLFIVVRSFFVTLTHLGIYPNQIVLGSSPLDKLYLFLNMQDGFFFSGHTGLPFLLALIFWYEKPWRYFFFTVSLMFGITVLFAHVHYSIDVFAAPFMTYSIFKFAELELFRKDYAIMVENV